MDLFLGNPTFELSIYSPKDLRLSVFCSVTQEHPFPEGKMYPFLSVPTTLRRTRWMRAISHPTLNCWKLVWWFPWSLALWLLLMAVFQPVENHCFSEPLLIMWVCCLWRLIIDPVSYKKEAVISPKGQGHHWSPGSRVSYAAVSLRGVHVRSKISKILDHSCCCSVYSEYQKSNTILNHQWKYSSPHFRNSELSKHIEELACWREIECD